MPTHISDHPNTQRTGTPNSTDEQAKGLQEGYKLERLKFVHKRQASLNDYTFKALSFFQAISTALVIAGVTAYSSWEKVGLEAEDARIAVRAIQWLLIGVGIFMLATIVSSVGSWWDNRDEECDLFDEVIGLGYRKRPSLASLWRWCETWLLIAVIVFVGSMAMFIEFCMLPRIK